MLFWPHKIESLLLAVRPKLKKLSDFLNLLVIEHKKSILEEQVGEVMTPQVVGENVYQSSIFVRGFEYL